MSSRNESNDDEDEGSKLQCGEEGNHGAKRKARCGRFRTAHKMQ